jgi:hypothetical protein
MMTTEKEIVNKAVPLPTMTPRSGFFVQFGV